MADEFYVGYLDRAPAGVARRVRVAVAAIALVVVAVAIVTVASQAPFARSHFEFGTTRTFTGRIDEGGRHLLLPRPGTDAALVVPLVAFGKFGPDALTADWKGRGVTLEGTLIYRDGVTMIELVDGSLREADVGRAAPPATTVGEETELVGEIVDSKCFLGVMKPGNLKPHRACATRCISGGIPPLLLVRDASGNASYYWLEDDAGTPLREQVLDHVAEPVALRGRIHTSDGRLVFRVDPATLRRVPGQKVTR